MEEKWETMTAKELKSDVVASWHVTDGETYDVRRTFQTDEGLTSLKDGIHYLCRECFDDENETQAFDSVRELMDHLIDKHDFLVNSDTCPLSIGKMGNIERYNWAEDFVYTKLKAVGLPAEQINAFDESEMVKIALNEEVNADI